MRKTKVKEDELGLYVIAGGWRARPTHKTFYSKGMETEVHHFAGSTIVGVGSTGFRGHYAEHWRATVMHSEWDEASNMLVVVSAAQEKRRMEVLNALHERYRRRWQPVPFTVA